MVSSDLKVFPHDYPQPTPIWDTDPSHLDLTALGGRDGLALKALGEEPYCCPTVRAVRLITMTK